MSIAVGVSDGVIWNLGYLEIAGGAFLEPALLAYKLIMRYNGVRFY